MMDQYTFGLQERLDKNNAPYLFGSLRMINAVLFIYPADSGKAGEYKAILRPYRNTENDFSWNDSTLETTPKTENKK
jgi:hypothetical protein